MKETILVNFHCHSIFSDGDSTPEALAANLASSGVQYAALTDHDSLEGLPRFQEALKKRGVSCLIGVELTTWYKGREAHLLAYGFDPDHPDLTATLLSLRQVRELEVYSIAGSLRKMGTNRAASSDTTSGISVAPDGKLQINDAIALIHRAGGKAFWAHPIAYEADLTKLNACVAELKKIGLDGLETLYAPYTKSQKEDLSKIAREHGLLPCAGTDFHAGNSSSMHTYAIKMPRQDWIQFREAIFASPIFRKQAFHKENGAASSNPKYNNPTGKPRHFQRRSYALRIFLPTVIAIALFMAAIWAIILPSFEQILLERKRELIKELTNSAWSILASYERDVQNNLLTQDQAQALAITRIQDLRYGPEGKDYFWIQDMQPRMIMHPYRSDLNGQDLSSFNDLRGVPIFVEFADLVRRKGEGYIDYVWQWKDDPSRLEPKESYVKGFEPWGWVIGTGIYTDDVKEEIAGLEKNLTNASLVISGGVLLLLIFVLQQSLRIEHERQEVLDSLRESTERYHTLVEATTEGTLLILEQRCRYANPKFLNMSGYTAHQLDFLDLSDLIPRDKDNQALWERFERESSDLPANVETFEGLLKQADGSMLECVLAVNPIVFAGQQGFILLVRELSTQPAFGGEAQISTAARSAPIGIFRARAARRATLVEMNPAAHTLFTEINSTKPALADLFSDPSEFEELLLKLQNGTEINKQILHLETHGANTRFLSLSARLVQDESNKRRYIDGTLEDVTTSYRLEAGRQALIEKLQSSLLFLHEPLSSVGHDMQVCNMNSTIAQISRQMTAHNVTAALVASENSTIIGIVTDHDLRARVLSENLPPNTPVHTIMSAPVTKISENALIYEALLRMEEKGVRHLAVEDRNGQIVSVIDSKTLIQFQRYGPIVLAREIAHSKNIEEVVLACSRTPPLVKALLDSSARSRHITHMLASTCDAATERLVQLAVDELGPPPSTFDFIAMGSQGRQEQTLVTDQDNGIIYFPSEAADPQQTRQYFLQLGEMVCTGLQHAGYAVCRGKVMADNPRWCKSLPEWISEFETWISTSEPQEIIDLSIFFDFRTVYGNADLTHELRNNISAVLRNQPGVFHHFAQNALGFKPPFRLLGNIYLGAGATDHAGEINLKDAMMPIVSFARLYALRHQINHTHTIERIDAMCDRNLILPSSRDEIVTAYDFLMQLRLQSQISAIHDGNPPTNIMHPARLGYIQQELLKQAFAQINAVQKKISYDFLGGM